MNLAIGEYFESFIKSLKSSFGGVFESISEVLNFAISILENILLLDHELIYPSILIGICLAGLAFYFCNKKSSKKIAIIFAILIAGIFGAMETWRASILNEKVYPEEAAEFVVQIESYSQNLKAIQETAPSDIVEQAITQNKRLKQRFQRINTPKLKSRVNNLHSYQLYLKSNEALQLSIDRAIPEQAEALKQSQEIGLKLQNYNPKKLHLYPWFVMIFILSLLAYMLTGKGLTILSVIGFTLIMLMNLWQPTMETLALVLSATCFALLIGVPLGILSAGNKTIDAIVKPILDFMQTMPAFVYLIPAVIFFGLGKVPGAMATLIFAMPPAVRLTSLGIRSVPKEVVEAAQAFGATPLQLLFKAQLPIALPTILAGLNQTIMLSLSMVVIGGMIGAGGLGEVVLAGITQLKIGLGFESGLSVVILAIYLDRLTQALGSYKK